MFFMDDPSSYYALIPVKIIDGLEAYIAMDKPMYRIGVEGKTIILLKNYSGSKNIKYKITDENDKLIIESNTVIGGGEYKKIEQTVNLPDKPGKHMLKLYINDKIIDEVYYFIDDPSRRKPFYYTFVWHHHQAPNYLPDGRIHGPWAYTYVWDPHLHPYGLGPYHYHAKLLDMHRSFKSTYNLSPSLLRQWEILLEKGVEYIDGRKYTPDSEEAKRVKETLELYRSALKRNQIDVLTSIYAHTIAGFLTDVLNMHDIIREEIRYGYEVTRRVMGEEYKPLGIWTPEMAFSMSLVPIYYDNDIKYTVLDDQHHFYWAEGDKDSQYEPYILVDTSTRKSIVVFFRDHELSDILGFRNNFYSEPHAWRNAYETVYRITEKWYDLSVKTLVLALDGENWMVFARNKPLTAYYLKHLVIYLESVQDMGFVKLSTLREMYNEVPSKRVLTKIPTNTWLGTFRKWRGEIADHEKYWYKVVETYRKLRAYESLIQAKPGEDKYASRIRWNLWHALDSDYWWAEFWKPDVIDTWLHEASKILDELLSKIRVKEIKIKESYYEDYEGEVLVVLENKLDREVYARILVSSIKTNIVRDEVKPLKILPYSTHSRSIPIKPGVTGCIPLIVAVIANNYIVNHNSVEVCIKPYIPQNPV